jgi:hypothetical protein
MTTSKEEEAGDSMTKRKRNRKRRSQPNFNPMMKTVNQGTQAVIGLGALGIVSTAVVKIAKP